MKQIYCQRLDASFDWVFATNTDAIALEKIINIYRKRWRIETGFRVQDEAQIKCKSKEMKIRYFLFMFEQMLQTQWVCFYKEEVSFKKFVIEMSKQATEACSQAQKHVTVTSQFYVLHREKAQK